MALNPSNSSNLEQSALKGLSNIIENRLYLNELAQCTTNYSKTSERNRNLDEKHHLEKLDINITMYRNHTS